MRLSFSRSLCDHLAAQTAGAEVKKVTLKIGNEIAPQADSPNGLYAVCKARTGWPLRVTMFKALADSWRHESRVVRECWLLPED